MLPFREYDHNKKQVDILQGPPKNLPRSIYPISSFVHPNQSYSVGLRRIARWEMK